MRGFRFAGVVAALSVAVAAQAQFNFSQSQTTDALRGALELATNRTAGQLGAKDGYFSDALVKILLPPEAQAAAELLRTKGGRTGRAVVDDILLKMNRAAEAAAAQGQTRTIFLEAIKGLTIADGLTILRGDSVAATRLLQSRTHDQLLALYRPVVAQQMQAVGLQQSWQKFATTYNRFSFLTASGKPLPTDIGEYVVGKALEGFFATLGRQEAAIRKDPVGKAEGLVRDVFSAVLPKR